MRYQWTIVAGCAVGLAASISPVFYNTLPVFLKAISAETGWGRTQIISSVSVCTTVAILTSPMIGRLTDRYGPRRVIAAAAIPFGMSIVSLKFLGSSYLVYLALAVLIGFFGNCANTFVYLSFMPRWFDRRLGLSLGLAATGIGVGQSLAPLVASSLLGSIGWRDGFAILGVGSAAIMLGIALLVLRDNPAASGRPVAPAPEGLTLPAALRTLAFWRLGASILLITATVTGCSLHMVPMLMDRGIPAETAARMASMIGICVLVGRFATGFILDRVRASAVAGTIFVAPAIAVALLWLHLPTESYYLATAMVGLALGAEGDIMAYMVRRAFGTRSYSEIYGWLWAAFSGGLLVGPILMGASFDLLGSYQPMLIVLGAFALSAAMLVPSIDGVRRSWQPA